jgi:prepilin-type processing-associated H-X9-DG protein
MNAFFEGGFYDSLKQQSGIPYDASYRFPAYRAYSRISDLQKPVPSELFVFVDEHPDSINDGWLINDPTTPEKWVDLPASCHNKACAISYADGHAAMHKWRDGSTFVPVKKQQYNGFNAGGGGDLLWMIQHSTALHE